MKISKKYIENIIENQLRIISEDRDTFTLEKSSEDAKIILIASEFFKKIFLTILEKIKAESHQTKKNNHIRFIEQLFSSQNYENIINSIQSITGTNSSILLAKKRLDAGNRFLKNYENAIKQLFAKDVQGGPDRVKKVTELTQDFIKNASNFTKYLDEVIVSVRKLFNYSGNNSDVSNDFIPKDILESISFFEKVGFQYLSEIELLFQKFLSIKKDIIESEKKWEQYPALAPQTAARDIVMQGKNAKQKAKEEVAGKVDMSHYNDYDKYANMLTGHMSPEFHQPTPLKFDIKKFLNALYGAREKNNIPDNYSKMDTFMRHILDLKNPNIRESLNKGQTIDYGGLQFTWNGKDFINKSGLVAAAGINNKLKILHGLIPGKTPPAETEPQKKKAATKQDVPEKQIKSAEEKKADNISKSIWKLDEYNRQIVPEMLKNVHEKLWNDQQNVYYQDQYVRDMFFDLHSAKKECRQVLNTVLRELDSHAKNGKSIMDFFDKNSSLIELFIRRVQFFKVSLKNSFLKIVTLGKAGIDRNNEPGKISKEQEGKVNQRLEYWNLFRKMGWTDKDAPDFIYQ